MQLIEEWRWSWENQLRHSAGNIFANVRRSGIARFPQLPYVRQSINVETNLNHNTNPNAESSNTNPNPNPNPNANPNPKP